MPTIEAHHREPFDPKKHPAVYQSDQSIRAFGIEFQSRYGVLSEYRALISAVETWMPRGLFWHIEKIFFDSKGGCVAVTLKERDFDLSGSARQIASILRLHLGDRCLCVVVEDHNGNPVADAREYC